MLAVLAVLIAAPASSEVDAAPADEAAGAPVAAEEAAAEPAAPAEEPVPPAEEPAAPAEEPQAAPAGRVERGAFTTAVVDREPQDSLDTLSNRSREVFYFSEIRGVPGETITHRWEWDGKLMAEVSFDVGGPRWRAHSSKRLDPIWLGEWTVTVLDSAGRVLSSESFTYTDAGAEVAPATEVSEEAPAAGGETPPAAQQP
jgi:hypothetical protein